MVCVYVWCVWYVWCVSVWGVCVCVCVVFVWCVCGVWCVSCVSVYGVRVVCGVCMSCMCVAAPSGQRAPLSRLGTGEGLSRHRSPSCVITGAQDRRGGSWQGPAHPRAPGDGGPVAAEQGGPSRLHAGQVSLGQNSHLRTPPGQRCFSRAGSQTWGQSPRTCWDRAIPKVCEGPVPTRQSGAWSNGQWAQPQLGGKGTAKSRGPLLPGPCRA